jgi:hypothetical protein
MIHIKYPEPTFSIKTIDGREAIYDSIRKQWVALTEEEWVRQNFIEYLVNIKQYPRTLIAVEKEMRLGELKKRFDILVYNKQHEPWMMIECKAASVGINQKVIDQILRYNISIPVPYLIVTNGIHCFGFERKSGSLCTMQILPEWQA